MHTELIQLIVLAFVVATVLMTVELADALRPPACPECPHCRARRAREERRRHEVAEHWARRDPHDDDRRD